MVLKFFVCENVHRFHEQIHKFHTQIDFMHKKCVHTMRLIVLSVYPFYVNKPLYSLYVDIQIETQKVQLLVHLSSTKADYWIIIGPKIALHLLGVQYLLSMIIS